MVESNLHTPSATVRQCGIWPYWIVMAKAKCWTVLAAIWTRLQADLQLPFPRPMGLAALKKLEISDANLYGQEPDQWHLANTGCHVYKLAPPLPRLGGET